MKSLQQEYVQGCACHESSTSVHSKFRIDIGAQVFKRCKNVGNLK